MNFEQHTCTTTPAESNTIFCKHIDSPVFCSDGELALVNGIHRAFDINNTSRKLKRCTFHLNKNVRDLFTRCMEHEINPEHAGFNAEVFQYYLIMLKEFYLPSNIVIALNQYLLRCVKSESFHYNRTENLRLQCELERCLITITNKYQKYGEHMSMFGCLICI